jgi:3-methyl-2-oxobutanoate hydroxymethyltransferase
MTKITVTSLKKMKQAGERSVALTAYDATFARVLELAGVEIILVGDSLGMVIQGHDSTLPVSLEDMIYHTQAVRRGVENAFIMVDMPFMSYTDEQQALHNAGRLLKEGGAHIVKLEGGAHMVGIVKKLAAHGIPVCGHLGLQPQSVNKLGGYRLQGRDNKSALTILEDAVALEQAGADMMLLECVPKDLALRVTKALEIPTIGIGAGPHCDCQVLVLQDMLGITQGKVPRFSKNYLIDSDGILNAVKKYVSDVKSGEFPAQEHTLE